VDLSRVYEVMEKAFSHHIEDGTVDVLAKGDQVKLDGGNWDLIVFGDSRVATDMPMNDA
jgi:hypothetical protein